MCIFNWFKLSVLRFIAALMVLTLWGCSPEPAAPARTAISVGVVSLQTYDVTITSELSGRTRAHMVAQIRPQVTGIVQKRLFTEGAEVKAGQVLYQLDPATYQAAYAMAQANLEKAEARVQITQISAKRQANLVLSNAISQQDNDDAQAALLQARAELAVAKAALESARIQLAYTKITAPIAGRVDTSSVTPGALVTANQEAALTTVQQLDTLYVDVTQSSAELLRLKHELAAGRMQQAGQDEVWLNLVLEDGSRYAQRAKLQFSGVTVNPSTGSVTLRAVVPNPQTLLLPGMYVRAWLQTGVAEQAVLIPQQAVTRSATGGAWAWVVDANNQIEKRNLELERAVGNMWQLRSGAAAGERVVVEGSQKIKVGASVNPKEVVLALSETAKAMLKTATENPCALPLAGATAQTIDPPCSQR